MIVVADTTPLRYLVVIGCEHLLPALFGRVLIPPAVVDELNHQNAPAAVRAWLAARPSWLEIRQPSHTLEPAVDRLGRAAGDRSGRRSYCGHIVGRRLGCAYRSRTEALARGWYATRAGRRRQSRTYGSRRCFSTFASH